MKRKSKKLKRTAAITAGSILFISQVSCRRDKIKLEEYDWNGSSDVDASGRNYDQYKDAEKLINAWMPPAGSPWTPYFKQTLLASADDMWTGDDENARSVAKAMFTPIAKDGVMKGINMASSQIPEHAAIFLDVPGEEAVVWGVELADMKGYQPIFTFNNGTHPHGVLQSHRVLGTAIYYASTMEALKQQGKITKDSPPVFLLDSQRLSMDAKLDSNTYDNRYYLSPSDLPSADQLKSAGIQHIVYVTPAGNRQPEQIREQDDLNEYFTGLAQGGLDFAVVTAETFNEQIKGPDSRSAAGGSWSSSPSPTPPNGPRLATNPWLWYWLGRQSGGYYGAYPYTPAPRQTFFHGGSYTGPGRMFMRSSSGGFGGGHGLHSGGSGG